jgi:ferric-dicitrate binding protein FerR (iron transport regulator)
MEKLFLMYHQVKIIMAQNLLFQLKHRKVNVLGTKFNVKSYGGDDVITTTLVEGKVKVENGENQILLFPNQQSKVDSNSAIIDVSDVDVSQQISWIKGLFFV